MDLQGSDHGDSTSDAWKVAFAKLPVSQLTAKPVMHFVHANGFPAGTYGRLFEYWQTYFTICTIERLGTNYRYAIDDNWRGLTQEVLDSIEDTCRLHGVSSLVAVGHSVGALTTLQALHRNPRHISMVVLLDPPLYMGGHSLSWYLLKQSEKLPLVGHRFTDKVSPAGKSKYRKDRFANRQAAYDNLRHKGLFKNFDEQSFANYLTYGFVDSKDGQDEYVRLAIPKAVEVAIFRTMPMNYWYRAPSVPRPVHLFAGRDSPFYQSGSYGLAKSKMGIGVDEVEGSHMFPLEQPDATAQRVLTKLAELAHQL